MGVVRIPALPGAAQERGGTSRQRIELGWSSAAITLYLDSIVSRRGLKSVPYMWAGRASSDSTTAESNTGSIE